MIEIIRYLLRRKTRTSLTILAVGLTPLADFAWVVIAGTVTGTLSSLFVVGSFALRALENERLRGPVDSGRQASALQP